MSVLPTSEAENGESMSIRSNRMRVPGIFNLRQIVKPQHLDFELAAWQLTHLCLSPRRVYRNVYLSKQTKNTWARDDPAILLLISACLIVTAAVWSIVYSYSLVEMVRLALLMVFRDFILSGLIIATLTRVLSNRFLIERSSANTNTETVEWAYAFDIHINSFFPLFLTLYVAQLPLYPIIVRSNWICLWVGNTLYLAAFSQYVYGTYLGFNALPFLYRTQLLLAPLPLLFITYIISLLGFNVGKAALYYYFQ